MFPNKIYLFFLIFLTSLLAIVSHSNKIKSYEEKKEIAQEMKKIAKALGVKCNYCHTEAERGLREGDFTLLTRKGQFAHDVMFPLSDKFKVTCAFCHDGYEKFTPAGERASLDAEYIKEYNKKSSKKINCETCHIVPQNPIENPFASLTDFARSMR